MDIAEFLTARYDEDETVAQTAALAAGTTDGTPDPEWTVFRGAVGASGGVVATGIEEIDESIGVHIARHDPARVLADITAKRMILELHGGAKVPASCCVREWEGYTVTQWYDARTDPCPTLRALAAPYSSHPDYDPTWRIDG